MSSTESGAAISRNLQGHQLKRHRGAMVRGAGILSCVAVALPVVAVLPWRIGMDHSEDAIWQGSNSFRQEFLSGLLQALRLV